MNTENIVMCVVALLLGMLLANMLKNVCRCKNIVEGVSGEEVLEEQAHQQSADQHDFWCFGNTRVCLGTADITPDPDHDPKSLGSGESYVDDTKDEARDAKNGFVKGVNVVADNSANFIRYVF